MRLKKIILPILLICATICSFFYAVFTYIFTDDSILVMLAQSKPEVTSLIYNLKRSVSLQLTNQVGLGLLIILCLVIVAVVFSREVIGKRIFWLAFLVPAILVFAYPTISRDTFSYLFSAKIVLVYQQSPYLVPPLFYWGRDLWIGFVHNVRNLYQYGPTALLISLLPMAIVGAEKFALNIYILKIISLTFFIFGAWLWLYLSKNRKLVLIMWVLNPFIINELLINGHNDLFMIVLFWWAIYLKQKSKTLMALLTYSLSVGVKFMTVVLLPIFFVPKKIQTIIALSTIVVITSYLTLNANLLWYFSWIYFCLPYLKLNKAQIFSILALEIILTLTYAGFLKNGLWGTSSSIQIIESIISTKMLFGPMFVLATIGPYLWSKFKLLYFS